MKPLMMSLPYAAARKYITPLLEEHYQESCTRKEVFTLAPNWEQYRILGEANLLIAVVAFNPETMDAIGYAVAFMRANAHYQGTLQADEDVLYLSPAYRHGRTGLDLMKFITADAKERGCTIYIRHAKPDTPLDRILARRGPVHEHVYLEAL